MFSPRFTKVVDSVRSARRSLVGASFIIIQPLMLNAISLPVTAYIIATLGSTDYGAWSVALTLVTTCGILTNLGLRSFFIRGVARQPETAANAFAEQLSLRMTLAIGAGAVATGTAYSLGYSAIVWQCTAILAAGGLFTAAAAVVSDLLAATERLPALATINLVSGLLLTAASVVAMWLHTGPLGLAVAYLVGPVVTGALSLLLVQRRLFRVRLFWRPRRFWSLLKECRVLGLQLFVMNLGNQAENLLVPKLVGLSNYGYFAAGTLLPRRLEVVPDGLNTAFFPVLARGYQLSPKHAAAAVRRFGLFMLAACVPAAVLLFVLADPLAQLLFPEAPDTCRTVIQMTVWWVPLIGGAYGMGYALNAAGRESDEARIAIVGTLISLAVSVVSIWRFGVIGACFALVFKAALGLTLRVPYLVKTLKANATVGAPPRPAVEASL